MQFKRQDLDHAFVSTTLLVEPLVLGSTRHAQRAIEDSSSRPGFKDCAQAWAKKKVVHRNNTDTLIAAKTTRSHVCCQAWAPFSKTLVAKLYLNA